MVLMYWPMASSRLKPADIWENVYCVADTLLYPQLVVRILMSAILASMCTDKNDFFKKFNTKGNFDRTPRNNL